MPGRNDPCPCGSGKKYKKCCLEQEEARQREAAPTHDHDHDHDHDHGCGCGESHEHDGEDGFDQFLDELDRTTNLAERLGWTSFDFGLDPFDPILDDLLDLAKDEVPAEESRGYLEVALSRAVPAGARARCLAELERRAEAASLEDDPDVETAVDALADSQLPSIAIGLVRVLFAGHYEERLAERQRLEGMEEERKDEELFARTTRAAEAHDPEAILRVVADAVRLGDDAIHHLEMFGWFDGQGDEAIPVVRALAERPSIRTAGILARMAGRAASAGLLDAIQDALAATPDVAWPLLRYRAEYPGTGWPDRAAAYELLVRARAWEVFRILVREFLEDAPWEQPCPEGELRRVAGWIARLGDARSVGHLVAILVTEECRPDAREALAEGLGPTGWWTRIETDVRRAEDGEDVLAWLDDDDVDERSEAYHEGLDWMRPVDVSRPGDDPEHKLAAAEWFASQPDFLQLDPDEVDDEDLTDRTLVWMTTRGPDGRIPLVEMLAGTSGSPHPGFAIWDRDRQLDELSFDARMELSAGHRREARRLVEAILEADPAHPFAGQLAKRLRA